MPTTACLPTPSPWVARGACVSGARARGWLGVSEPEPERPPEVGLAAHLKDGRQEAHGEESRRVEDGLASGARAVGVDDRQHDVAAARVIVPPGDGDREDIWQHKAMIRSS